MSILRGFHINLVLLGKINWGRFCHHLPKVLVGFSGEPSINQPITEKKDGDVFPYLLMV